MALQIPLILDKICLHSPSLQDVSSFGQVCKLFNKSSSKLLTATQALVAPIKKILSDLNSHLSQFNATDSDSDHSDIRHKLYDLDHLLQSVPNPRHIYTKLELPRGRSVLGLFETNLRKWGWCLKSLGFHSDGTYVKGDMYPSDLLYKLLKEWCTNLEILKLEMENVRDWDNYDLDIEFSGLKLQELGFKLDWRFMVKNPPRFPQTLLASIVLNSPSLTKLVINCPTVPHFHQRVEKFPDTFKNLKELHWIHKGPLDLSCYVLVHVLKMNFESLQLLSLISVTLCLVDVAFENLKDRYFHSWAQTLESLVLKNVQVGCFERENDNENIFLQYFPNLRILVIEKHHGDLGQVINKLVVKGWKIPSMESLVLDRCEFSIKDVGRLCELFPNLLFLHLDIRPLSKTEGVYSGETVREENELKLVDKLRGFDKLRVIVVGRNIVAGLTHVGKLIVALSTFPDLRMLGIENNPHFPQPLYLRHMKDALKKVKAGTLKKLVFFGYKKEDFAKVKKYTKIPVSWFPNGMPQNSVSFEGLGPVGSYLVV